MYYYVTNLQGDVLSLVDGEGFSAAEYYYNAWGLPMGSTGAMAEINPLRYRGYYYDTELGMYYLKSRYYDPFVCRFINADSTVSTGQDFSGNNMFAYCGNNPVARGDSEGRLWVTLGK
ncbi:MAG: RHS repeat-associated core domain-containing protein [Oscillospiraceae bacterium]|nr:RHS repeat-associated core domain-containing protein [Oscillospiraceae bacterium]